MPCNACYQAVPSFCLIVVISWIYYTYLAELCLKGLVEYPTRQLIYLVGGNVLFFMFALCYLHVMFSRGNFTIPQAFKLSKTEHNRLLTLPSSEQKEVLEQYIHNRHITVWLRTSDNFIRYCMKCHVIKPDRTHHCSACERCVLKMDHHCPWTNNCVGFVNHKSFMLMLIYGSFCCLSYPITLIEYYLHIEEFKFDYHTVALCSGFSAACVLLAFIYVLYYQHFVLLLKNITVIETIQEMNFSNHRLTFDLGTMDNFLDVFGECFCYWWIPFNSSYGNGVNFEVRYKR